MICPKCGALLEEDSKFCISCGTNLEVGDNSIRQNDSSIEFDEEKLQSHVHHSEGSMESKSSRKINILGLIAGTLLIVIGISRIIGSGTSISSAAFGADFYTYVFQGIVAISEILSSIQVSIGWLIIAIGVAIDVISLRR